MCPNRCYNTVDINGPKEEIEIVHNIIATSNARGKDDDYNFFQQILPLPKEHQQDRYEWHCKHRGCKRDVDPCIYDESLESISFGFDSPWGPPQEGLLALSKQIPHCLIAHSFDEGGMGFSGEYEYKNGETILAVDYDDAYYGKTQECVDCHCKYPEESEDDEYKIYKVGDERLCRDCKQARLEDPADAGEKVLAATDLKGEKS